MLFYQMHQSSTMMQRHTWTTRQAVSANGSKGRHEWTRPSKGVSWKMYSQDFGTLPGLEGECGRRRSSSRSQWTAKHWSAVQFHRGYPATTSITWRLCDVEPWQGQTRPPSWIKTGCSINISNQWIFTVNHWFVLIDSCSWFISTETYSICTRYILYYDGKKKRFSNWKKPT